MMLHLDSLGMQQGCNESRCTGIALLPSKGIEKYVFCQLILGIIPLIFVLSHSYLYVYCVLKKSNRNRLFSDIRIIFMPKTVIISIELSLVLTTK